MDQESIDIVDETAEFHVPVSFHELVDMDSAELVAHVFNQDGVITFNEEVMMWQEYLSRLEPYEDAVIMKKLNEMDMDDLLPASKHGEMYPQYYRLVNTHKYLCTIHKPVHSRVEMLKDAIKSLKSAARGMFKGTEKDKDAHCDRMVRHFTAELSQARCLLETISRNIEMVDFAAVQASRVIKEREFELRTNGGYMNQGMGDIYRGNNREENPIDDDDNNPLPAKYMRRQSKNEIPRDN